MKVKLTKSGEMLDVSDSFGRRLLEQGKAVAVPEMPDSVTPKKGSKKVGGNGDD